MEQERILITVKTYPTLSRKYGETVCTAGLRENGTWVRLYPVPFRRLDQEEQYRLFDWVECRLRRNHTDPRPETFRPADPGDLRTVDHLDTKDAWRERRRIVLGKARVFNRLDNVIAAAKANEISLAVFKPARVVDFVWEEEDVRDWDVGRLERMRALTSQYDLFDDNTWRKTFDVIPKLPYNFFYRIEDANGRQSRMQILEWQIGALFWNCLRLCDGDETEALGRVKQKYFHQFIKHDLHFFLGTTQQWHSVAPNPWVIVGVFPIPHERQLGMF